MDRKSERFLKKYIFIVLYSSALKLILGRWGTLVADIATIFVLLFCMLGNGSFCIRIDKNIKMMFILICIVQFIAIVEIFHPNIQNRLYSIIEYRKSYFQLVAFLATYWIAKKANCNVVEMLRYIGNISLPIILYGIKQYYLWGSIDTKLIDMTDADFYTMHYGGHMRSVSIFSGPFHYGMFCAVMFALYMYLLLEYKRIKKQRSILFFAIIALVGAVCSITRTSLVCIIVCIAIWFLLYLQKKKSVNAFLINVLAMVTVVFAISVIATGLFEIPISDSNSSLGKMLNSLGNLSEDNRFTSRTLTWEQGIQNIIQSPVIGWGMGSAADTMSSYNISNVYITSHSMYIKMFMEIGVFGGLMYLTIFVFGTQRIISGNKESDTIKVLCMSLLSIIFLNGLVGSTIPSFPCMTIYWIIIGLLFNSRNDEELQLQKISVER